MASGEWGISRRAFVALPLLACAPMSNLYPADYLPLPGLAYGTAKLRSTYNAPAMNLYKASNGTSTMVGFNGDSLDTATLDAFTAGTPQRVTLLYDQMGSGANLAGTLTESPSILDLAIGSARTVVFQGGSQSGALFWLQADISSLAIAANTWTMMAVVQPSSSMYCNQQGAPDLSSGALTNFSKAGGASVAEIYNNSQVGGGPGGWQVSDGGAFNYTSPEFMVPANPQVLTITSGPNGVRVWVNEQIRSTASRSALTDPVVTMRLGGLIGSVAGAASHAFDGQVAALMIWSSELSQSEAALRRSALYRRFQIDPRTTSFNSYSVSILGDSIAAGYIAFGLYGYADYLPALLNHANTRMLSYAVPGSTITQNPYGSPVYANTVGLYPTGVKPSLRSCLLGRVVIIHGGGNDALIGPGFRTGTSHGNNIITGLPTTADLTPGMYVFKSDIPSSTLATIVSVDSGTQVTLSGAANSSFTSTVIFGSASPTAVYAGIQSLATQALADGATGVLVSTILPRNDVYTSWINATNALIRAGVTGATIVDAAVFPGLNTNPGTSYGDSGHMTALGNQQMAACLAPYINAMMP